MMELSSGFDHPNPYGLHASDFDHNMDEYAIALRFLGDLAGGTTEVRALEVNGGNPAMLRAWEHSTRFRRVLGKCRQANAEEIAVQQRRETEETERVASVSEANQRFIPLEEMPIQRNRTFSMTPDAGTWGA